MASDSRAVWAFLQSSSLCVQHAAWWGGMAVVVLALLSFLFVVLAVFQVLLSGWRTRSNRLRDAEDMWKELFHRKGSSNEGAASPSDDLMVIPNSHPNADSPSFSSFAPSPLLSSTSLSSSTLGFLSTSLSSSPLHSCPLSNSASHSGSSSCDSSPTVGSRFPSVVHVVIVVLGDLARSPRMIYHAQALASSISPPPIIHVIAYTSTPVPPSLSRLPFLQIHSLPVFALDRLRRFFPGPFVFVFLFFKLLQQTAALSCLLLCLLRRLGRRSGDGAASRPGSGTQSSALLRQRPLVLVQAPPALPTVLVCGVTSRLMGAKMLLDWHNFGFTLMFPERKKEEGSSAKMSPLHAFAKTLAAHAEGWGGRLAAAALCVSKAMQETLKQKWGLRAAVLYDHPNAQIRPIDLGERHQIAVKYMRLPSDFESASRRPGDASKPLCGRARCQDGERKHEVSGKQVLRSIHDAATRLADHSEGDCETSEGLSSDPDSQRFAAFVEDCDGEGTGAIPQTGRVSRLFPGVPADQRNTEHLGQQPHSPRTHLLRQWTFPAQICRKNCGTSNDKANAREKESLELVETTLVSRARLVCGSRSEEPAVNPSSETPVQGGSRTCECCQVSVEIRRERPAVLLTATSWTGDEDMDLFLHALRRYDSEREWEVRSLEKSQLDSCRRPYARDCNTTPEALLPSLLVLISGRGPKKNQWLQRARQCQFRHIAIRTLFATLDDYYKLLAAVDVGVCVHTSSSGIDLPMKVVDLKGAGVPVCAYEFPAIHELVQDGQDALLFVSAEGLCAKLQQLLRRFPLAFDEAVESWQQLTFLPTSFSACAHARGSKATQKCDFSESNAPPLQADDPKCEASSPCHTDEQSACQSQGHSDACPERASPAPRCASPLHVTGGHNLFEMRRFSESHRMGSFQQEWRRTVLPILRKLTEYSNP
ncbi:chitobiosyldiphosphodolichol beta-mannosyltransferase [Toxoplasma gondii ME49]|uniref:Beta-1,4-mannosyltransferase, putative n=3 Tax=Toxoplasma gondii TaxID=5811 RepID=A0A0F7V3S3_TOXGV|nr:chitobiosyldiphosphodolichol beta-mannosyltransferase [Toxoplasma gondii ME49]EPT29010.1 chitobiosyldiphosphodolichol beta-mannosyltransferase [Toxoplasma gondii ME49]ESS35635.1 chitobiosyldiphosphodolichol beta-mannosyltransferase [Toxoplasma gondii VEG]KYF46029.1 chitobiosyldiphosphodolichol beta-mannosyltransferase [Toxoplasma gondii ARI]CEL74785.1 TPA: beta-1,4-mannosyltransferase, putative [Toxoplasma gondii VEG]|eukprot:XP_018636880.1 chitobiosyldiphosphodolichol beta-mannosyltransferase [Toxoplasma gondii ME49]